MSRLEDRYRRVLRLLPASYREVWEEEMVSTFLESVETGDPDTDDFQADYGRPGWQEMVSVLALAVRLRIGTAGAPPRYARWSGAIRLAVLTCLLVNAAGALVGATVAVLLTQQLPPIPGYPRVWELLFLFGSFAGLLWLPAFLTLVRGHLTAARWLTAAAIAATAVSTVSSAMAGMPTAASTVYLLAINALLLPALTAFHRGTPPVSQRPWLIGLGAYSTVIAAYMFLMSSPAEPLPPLDWAGVECLTLLAATAAYAVITRRQPGRIDTAWTTALAILAFSVLGHRLVALLDYAVSLDVHGWHPATIPFGIAEAILVAAAAVTLAVVAGRDLRRLPTAPPGASAWSTST